jgi:hypothetical protein
VNICKTESEYIHTIIQDQISICFFFLISHRTTKIQVTKIYIWENLSIFVNCDWSTQWEGMFHEILVKNWTTQWRIHLLILCRLQFYSVDVNAVSHKLMARASVTVSFSKLHIIFFSFFSFSNSMIYQPFVSLMAIHTVINVRFKTVLKQIT